MMDVSRTGGWLRRALNFSGIVILVTGLVAVATFNASSQRHQLPNFTMPTSILLQLRDDDTNALMTVLVANNGRTWLVIPRDTVLDSLHPNVTIHRSTRGLDVGGASSALSTATNLDIQAGWQIDRLGLASFLELIGGIDVVPEHDMLLGKPQSSEYMSLRGGERVHLNGIYAAWFAFAGDTEHEQLQHFQIVWRELMLKTDAATLAPVLSSVGSVSRATMPLDEVVAVFEKWQQIAAVDAMEWAWLKTVNTQGIPVISSEGISQMLAAGIRERIAS